MRENSVYNATSIAIDTESLFSLLLQVSESLNISRPIAIRLVDSEEMIHLNKDFRKCPENTDVLTFPSGLDAPFHLGDIAICVPYAIEQAAMRNVSLENELVALMVHGCLHLIDYDDIEEDDRIAMQSKMNEVGKQIGIPIDGNWTSILHQDIEH